MRTAHAEANGLQMHYLESGRRDAPALVLLHGGTETAAACWSDLIPLLAGRWRVIAPDSRGHGGTTNDGRPLTYRLMAQDVAALCASLGIDTAAFCGFSDGANIILELAMRRPALVDAGVLHGCVVDFSPGYYEGIRAFFCIDDIADPADPAAMEATVPELTGAMRRWHAAQGAEHWQEVVRMVEPLFKTPLQYGDADFSQIGVPLLVLVGDRDEYLPLEEQVALLRRLPGAELAVMAGVSHGFPSARLYADLVEDFLTRRTPSRALCR